MILKQYKIDHEHRKVTEFRADSDALVRNIGARLARAVNDIAKAGEPKTLLTLRDRLAHYGVNLYARFGDDNPASDPKALFFGIHAEPSRETGAIAGQIALSGGQVAPNATWGGLKSAGYSLGDVDDARRLREHSVDPMAVISSEQRTVTHDDGSQTVMWRLPLAKDRGDTHVQGLLQSAHQGRLNTRDDQTVFLRPLRPLTREERDRLNSKDPEAQAKYEWIDKWPHERLPAAKQMTVHEFLDAGDGHKSATVEVQAYPESYIYLPHHISEAELPLRAHEEFAKQDRFWVPGGLVDPTQNGLVNRRKDHRLEPAKEWQLTKPGFSLGY